MCGSAAHIRNVVTSLAYCGTVAGDPSDQHYDARLAEAVKNYQRGHELKVTGVLDAPTIKELNAPTAA